MILDYEDLPLITNLSTRKDVQYHYLLDQYKSKPQLDSTSHPLGW